MILLVLFILFQYSLIPSLCQDDCEADVGIVLRSRCQSECDADVKMNVLYCVFPFCELDVDLFHELRRSQVRGTDPHPAPNGNTQSDKYVLSMFALITTSLPFISLAQHRVTNFNN